MEKIATKYILNNNKQKMFTTKFERKVCKFKNKSNTILNAIAVVFPSMDIEV